MHPNKQKVFDIFLWFWFQFWRQVSEKFFRSFSKTTFETKPFPYFIMVSSHDFVPL